MGVALSDRVTGEVVFAVNFWHYRAVVEAVRSLGVLPDETVDGLHELWQGTGLTADEARAVAAAIRERLLPTLAEDERLLPDGTRTAEPDDGTFHRTPDEQYKNYGTTRRVLERFAACCETCHGFDVG